MDRQASGSPAESAKFVGRVLDTNRAQTKECGMPEDLWPSPGYYPDPDERSGLTYWDGYKWHLGPAF